mmetsp:Transcript_88793/g.250112  ORF Transcript_88793/g.250112 Transcript_88793/m.250112 type:complete len:209 (+) Transcript_88793:35-661(+)
MRECHPKRSRAPRHGHARALPLGLVAACAIGFCGKGRFALSLSGVVASSSMVLAPCRGRVRGPSVQRAAERWGSPTWSWGTAVGDAHDAAAALRAKLAGTTERADWLEALIKDPDAVPWEDVKLALALLWQRIACEGRDMPGPLGWSMLMSRMVDAVYEGEEGDQILVADMDARLTQVPEGNRADAATWRRAVAACAFQQLDFVVGGL